MKRLKILLLVIVAVLSIAAVEAQSGLVYQGCWSPYPNCAGASDIYTDSAGRFWNCGRCGTTSNPPLSSCRQVGNLNNFGYWCS